RVSIYAALEEKAKVPFPVKDEIETVKQAMRSWVAWPKHLVIKSHLKVKTQSNSIYRYFGNIQLFIESHITLDMQHIFMIYTSHLFSYCRN
ncbi:hypothetical protein PSY81_23395, partial [Shigella flexneri]|nr:hypothetical protein [Shigella flexneri]